MKKVFERFSVDCDVDCKVEQKVSINEPGAKIYTFFIDWDYRNVSGDAFLTISLEEDAVGHLYYWNPDAGFNRSMPLGWRGGKKSMTSISAPVACIYDGREQNTFTCAVSEVKEIVELKTAIVNDKYFGVKVIVNLNQYVQCGHLELKLYVDETDIPMYEAIDNVRKWYEDECDLKPMNVPDCAKDAMYSYWYSFQQGLFQKEVLEEAKRVKELGLKTVILDDGWQMEGVDVRYAYTGDWQVNEKKFSDFKGAINTMHDLGLKVLLWIGIPYVGIESELWKKYKDKTIQHSEWARASILDPRYPEVREYIINAIKRLMTDYNLDGFKIDFVDLFYDVPETKINDEMDILSVQAATDRLMTDIKSELVKINPDVLIEFRQKYIGPNMRKYGNMFRVSDCPDNYLLNRVGVLDLRLLSGNTAVHSDMLMWNVNEKVEVAALQIINVIFGAMQFSGRLSLMSEEHKKMVMFWIEFMKKNKELLLNSDIIVEEAHLLYTLAKTEKNGETVIAVYAKDKCAKLSRNIDKATILNGTQGNRIIAEITNPGTYNVSICDCLGNVIEERNVMLNPGITSFDVPVAGMVTIYK